MRRRDQIAGVGCARSRRDRLFGRLAGSGRCQAASVAHFQIEEATIADIQAALVAKQITTVDVVNLYLARIKAYNGTCVSMPEGLLGPITTIPHAGQLNALGTSEPPPGNTAANWDSTTTTRAA